MACREGSAVCDLGERLVLNPGSLVIIPAWMPHRVFQAPGTVLELSRPADDDPRVQGMRLRPQVVPGRSLDHVPEPEQSQPVLRAVQRVHERGLDQGPGEIAEDLGYTLPYLTNLVSRQTGQSLGDWISQTRLAYAAQLLRHTPNTVAQVAGACGFADLCHFRRLFKRRHGLTPTQWRIQ